MPRSGADARRRLQQAALELFRERGYEATTTAEIAARAGVTERTFFRHFAVAHPHIPILQPGVCLHSVAGHLGGSVGVGRRGLSGCRAGLFVRRLSCGLGNGAYLASLMNFELRHTLIRVFMRIRRRLSAKL